MTGRERASERLLKTFLDELEERVGVLERSLLAYERDPAPEARTRSVNEMFRAAHSLKGAAHAVGIAPIEALCHDLETRLAPAREQGGQLAAGVVQLLLTATDTLSEAGRRLRAGMPVDSGALATALAAPSTGAAEPPGTAGAGDTTVRLSAERFDAIIARSAEGMVERRRLTAGLTALEDLGDFVDGWRGEWRRQRPLLRRADPDGASVADRLDERITALATLVADRSSTAREAARTLERVSAALDDQLRAARMQPFADACAGLERVVRDLSLARGREAQLEILGGEVRLDRAAVTRLRDPLRHLVRNAIDHGVEDPDRRVAAGKPRTATVRVAAALDGEQVVVTVSDDGAGFDDEAIRRRAIERGLTPPKGREELARAVLTPGFSTLAAVTKVSGRGVGLDAVRDAVEALHGSLALHWEPGRGSRCELRVPVSLATSHVVLVRAAGTLFALPASAVPKVRQDDRSGIRTVGGRRVLLVDAETPVPLASLGSLLGSQAEISAPQGTFPTVLVDTGSDRVAFAVDELIGEREVVATGLGRRLHDVPLVSGATVLETGEIALMLKPTALVRATSALSPTVDDSSEGQPTAATTRQRVLLVDDSATTRSLMRSIVEGAGYEVSVAVDGAQAWAQLQERLPDLVVSDVDMPRMDGFALCEAIRRSPRTRDLRVVLVTALGSDRDRARGMQVGADAYMVKAEFEQGTLLETLSRLLA